MKKIVLLAIASMFLIFTPGSTGSVQAADSPSIGVLSSPGGRYVFGQVSTYRSDQYMLDTHSGMLWRIIEVIGPNDKKTETLRPVPYDYEDGKYYTTPLTKPLPKMTDSELLDFLNQPTPKPPKGKGGNK